MPEPRKSTHQTRAVAPLGFALVAAVLTACSSSPSEADPRDALSSRIEREAEGRIRLVDFKKTNGVRAEVAGVSAYRLEYEAEIEFLQDVWWGCPMGLCFETVTGAPGSLNFYLYQGKKHANRGQRETVTGALEFRKTERGWRGPGGRIY